MGRRTTSGSKSISIRPARRELEQLPVVGEERARRLVENRPFESWEEVERVPGFDKGMVDDLRSGGAQIEGKRHWFRQRVPRPRASDRWGGATMLLWASRSTQGVASLGRARFADRSPWELEYGDYECPFCGAAHGIVNAILARMGDQLCFVYRHFQLTTMHPHAQMAAEAAEAAGAQGKFWAMHDVLFENQQRLDAPYLPAYAEALGLDTGRFSTELAERPRSEGARGLHQRRAQRRERHAVLLHQQRAPRRLLGCGRPDGRAAAGGRRAGDRVEKPAAVPPPGRDPGVRRVTRDPGAVQATADKRRLAVRER
jgi:hypothetical protein